MIIPIKAPIRLFAFLCVLFLSQLPVAKLFAQCDIVTAGTAVATPSTICAFETSTLSLSGASSDAGTTYHWQSSTDGAAWSNIPGETNATYTTGPLTDTMFYRSMVGCAFSSNSDSSTTVVVNVNPLPPAITGTPTACQGLTTTLSNTDAGGTWSSDNILVATVGSSSGIVNGVAQGTANITYINTGGCSAMQMVIINPLPDAINGITGICIGSVSTLTDDSTGGTWSSSNVTIATAGPSTGVISGVGVGTATISYTLPTSCLTTTQVTINQLPLVFPVTGGGSYCAGGDGISVGLGGTESNIRYELYNGATSTGIILPGFGSPLDFGPQTAAGVYTVLASNLNTGCKNNMLDSAIVIVVSLVTPSVSFIGGSHDTVCSGGPSAFTATPVHGGSYPSYEWSVNGSVMVTGATSNVYTYTPTDGDVVNVKLTSDEMCATPDTAISTNVITVIESVLPSISITPTPGNLVCAETNVTFTSLPINGGTSPVITWYKNGTLTGAPGSTFSYVPADADIIYCKLHSDLMCLTANDVASANIGMGVYPNYLPIVIISAVPGFNITPGEHDTLTATVTGGGPTTSYQWVKNHTPVPGATNAVYYDTFVNKDSISCIVVAGGPCGRPTFNSVIMNVSPLNVHSATNKMSDITLFPNPNTGTFTIKGSINTVNNEPVSVEIVNMTGQMIYKKLITVNGGIINEEMSINENVANGMYLLNVRSSGGNDIYHFVIQH